MAVTFLMRQYASLTANMKNRGKVACVRVANLVMNESAAAAGHAQRAQLAQNVLNNPGNESHAAALITSALASAASPAAACVDTEDWTTVGAPADRVGSAPDDATADTNFQSAIDGVWNQVAGYDPTP